MWKRCLILGAASAALVVGGALGYLNLKEPNAMRPEAVQVPMTPEVIARGEYLFTVVSDCDGCHSQRDPSRFAMPVVPGGRGKGFEFPAEMGLPGKVIAPNITPDVETGIGAWTDGEKIRAIREGISRDGRALFPMMPYAAYSKMSDSDVQALVAYMNTLPAIKHRLPQTALSFPVNLLIKDAPVPVRKVADPDRSDKLAYGRYLVSIAGCAGCHTPAEQGRPVPGLEFAGGESFTFRGMKVVSANITPDEDTGIGKLTAGQFVERFHQYKKYIADGPPAMRPENFTLMPWLGYARMEEEDLCAIFAYLKTVKPIRNAVETHPGF